MALSKHHLSVINAETFILFITIYPTKDYIFSFSESNGLVSDGHHTPSSSSVNCSIIGVNGANGGSHHRETTFSSTVTSKILGSVDDERVTEQSFELPHNSAATTTTTTTTSSASSNNSQQNGIVISGSRRVAPSSNNVVVYSVHGAQVRLDSMCYHWRQFF